MKTLLNIHLIILISMAPCIGFSQSVRLDSLQTERVAKACQLWGHLKYFHPYLGDDSIDWESVFVNSIEGVIKSKSTEDFGIAIQKMLAPLNDPATKVALDQETDIVDDSLKYPVVKFTEDSILVISIRDFYDLEDFNYSSIQFRSLKEKLKLSNGVLFDLRHPKYLGDYKESLSLYLSSFEGYFSKRELNYPGLKARFYDGFPRETGGSSGGYYSGYYSGYYVKGERKINPASASTDKLVVFVVNENSEIPLLTLALQNAGRAKVLASNLITDANVVETAEFELEDGVKVNIRVNELTTGFELKIDHLIPENLIEDEIVEIARQIIKGEKKEANLPETNYLPQRQTVQISDASNLNYPKLGHRLLAAAKIWTVIGYFFAYKDLMEDNWDAVLKKYIPRFAIAADSLEYHLVVAEMYKHIQDGHGVVGSRVLSAYFGSASPPINVRFIEEKIVVVDVFPDSVFAVDGIEVGDVILEINGEKAEDRTKRLAQYKSASNRAALHRDLSRVLLRGSDSTSVELKILKASGKTITLSLPRNNSFTRFARRLGKGRNHQPVIRLLNEDVGYADLDRLTVDKVDQMFEDFKETKAIIFDMRGYPKGTGWAIAPYLTDKKRVYGANYRRYSPLKMNLNIGEWRSENMASLDQLIPAPKFPTYKGKTVMLIDERTQSQAEHTGLFFEAANGTKFIGSQTAGANGDVTNFRIPGNITLYFSGHDVRHIDGRQLQKIGLVPDLLVKPTIKGIREGKDEVLEQAIKYVKNINKE